ncbi:MAG: riboflavin synthase [Nitrospira sp.]|nr:riboflavin synthase [Nitrospira sp.]
MFSGSIEEMGAISILNKGLAGTRLTIIASTIMGDLTIGASVSVNGACLTVAARTDHDLSVDVSPETLHVTTLGSLASGSPVNLERAMKLNERIGGHMVSGHVDGIGAIRSRHQDGNALILEVEAPKDILRLCVAKGSVTVDGISLTINDVTERSFAVSIIPHTAKITTLGLKQVGDQLNLESDLIGKYVERLLQERGILPPKPAPVIDKDYLKRRGLI